MGSIMNSVRFWMRIQQRTTGLLAATTGRFFKPVSPLLTAFDPTAVGFLKSMIALVYKVIFIRFG
jgi:hypothetical protein